MADLFPVSDPAPRAAKAAPLAHTQARRRSEPPDEPPALPLGPGCHDCPAWRGPLFTVRRCTGRGEPRTLTSWAYLCPIHPKFNETTR